MPSLSPTVRRRDPQTVAVDFTAPDLTLVANVLGSHLTVHLDEAQSRALRDRLALLLDGGASS